MNPIANSPNDIRRPTIGADLSPAITPAVFLLVLAIAASHARGQLTVLSADDATKTWQSTQLKLIEEQLAGSSPSTEMKSELESQRKWLSAWNSGGLTNSPVWQSGVKPAEFSEPAIDPTGVAAGLRSRLFGPDAQPVRKDTDELKAMLAKHSDDVGVRQLHLQWLDQQQYRKEYCQEIADAAGRVAKMIEGLEEQNEQTGRAIVHCLYRRARALAYRELPEVAEKKPIEDLQQHEADLYGTYAQIKETAQLQEVSSAQPWPAEFVLLEVRMLRRDHWNGRAIALLEDYGELLEPQWLLKKRRDILRDLGWEPPALEAAALYAQAFPEEAQKSP